MAVHHLPTKIAMKRYGQYIGFEVSVGSLSCAAFLDICLDRISTLLGMQLECKYFGSVAVGLCVFAVLLGVGIYLMKYWIHNCPHPCRKLKVFPLNSDVSDLGIRKTCVINTTCCILPFCFTGGMISWCCYLAAAH